MNPRIVNWIFGLIALAAVAIAVVFAYNGTDQTAILSPSPTPVASATATLLPTTAPQASASPSPQTSATPAAKTTGSTSAALNLANTIEIVPAGGSLIIIANAHDLTAANLVKVNGLKDANTVQAGQKIVVPDSVTDTDYTVLFTVNEARATKEKEKVASGVKSIYADPVIAFTTDANGLFGIAADTPFSSTNGTDGTTTTLTTSNDAWTITGSMEKSPDGFWIIKKLVAKVKP